MQIDELKKYLKSLPFIADEENSSRRKALAKISFKDAVNIYFSHHVTLPETSSFRNDFYKNSAKILKNNRLSLFKAYRGAAKTTLISRLFVLFLTAITQQKRNSIIIGSTIFLSKKTLEFIKTELEDNALLISDFEIQKGDKWTEEEIVFSSGGVLMRISVYGALKKIRGENWLSFRPDLVVCDDIENDENVLSKTQRDKLYNWFEKVILKLPSRTQTDYNIFVVGTTLHHDGLLKRLEARDDFTTYSYPLVIRFPSNLDSLKKESLIKADLKDMVVDDTTIDKVSLFKEYLQGKDSFMSEYQNEPLSRDGATFGGYEIFDTMPLCDAYYIGIDPALGKSKGDYFAITTLGFCSGKFYASVKMTKIKAELMIDRIIQTALGILTQNRPLKIAIETVQFQEFFKDVLESRANSLGIYLPIVPIKNSVAKELRIDSLAPAVTSGHIIIDKSSLLFLDELDTYPKSAHDDGLDSLEMAWRIAKAPNFDYEKVNEFLDKQEKRKGFFQSLLDKCI